MYIQKLPYSSVNLIVKGVAYNFDASGIYQGTVYFRYTEDLIPVRVESYITQGNLVEKVTTDDNGNVLQRSSMSTSTLFNEISTAKSQNNCLGVLIKIIKIENVSSTQYIVLYRK